jgi:uncharacterized damage-inducible protein DinB
MNRASRFLLPVLTAALLALGMPACMHAQTTSKAAAAQPSPSQIVDPLLSHFESHIVSAAEAMPADKYNFAPTNGNFQGVRTFAGQIQHIAQENYYIFGHAAGIEPVGAPDMKTLKTKAQLVSALKDSYAFAHRAVATLNKQNVREPVEFAPGINTRVGVMMFGIIHMNDHYGQMVEYLRMNGIVPPASRKK